MKVWSLLVVLLIVFALGVLVGWSIRGGQAAPAAVEQTPAEVAPASQTVESQSQDVTRLNNMGEQITLPSPPPAEESSASPAPTAPTSPAVQRPLTDPNCLPLTHP